VVDKTQAATVRPFPDEQSSDGQVIVPSEVVAALCSHSSDGEIRNIYSRLQIDLCDDIRDLWDPTFARLRGPDADYEAAYSLCTWLSATAAAYNRDAETSPSAEGRVTARARADLLRDSALELATTIEKVTGAKPPKEINEPPPPAPLVFFGTDE
jgi:hypothetical protein